MGYMTTITFLNDSYSNIENKKNQDQVIENILDAMSNTHDKSKTYPIGNFGNPMTAMKTHHADEYMLYFCYANMTTGIGFDSTIHDLDLRKRNLKMVKQLIKIEQEEIKKLEEKK